MLASERRRKFYIAVDLLAILQKSLDRALFYTFLYARFDRVFYHYCANSKILKNVAKYRLIEILYQNSYINGLLVALTIQGSSSVTIGLLQDMSIRSSLHDAGRSLKRQERAT